MDVILEALIGIITTTEFLGGGGFLTILATLVQRQFSTMSMSIAQLKVKNIEVSSKLEDAVENNDDFRRQLTDIQRLYGENLAQGVEVNRTTASLQNELNKMGKLINELRATILEKDTQISKFSAEVNRLLPFEKEVAESNGKILELTKRITELERHYELLQAEKRGEKNVLDAILVSEVTVKGDTNE